MPKMKKNGFIKYPEYPKHPVSVSPTIKQSIEFFCCYSAFGFDCNTASCCCECPMLKELYTNYLPNALDKESMDNLRKVVEPTGLFQHTEDGQSTCSYDCKKDEIFPEHVQAAINELYRYYYEVQSTM